MPDKRLQKGDLKKAVTILALLGLGIGGGAFGINMWENSRYKTEGGESTVDVDPAVRDTKTYEYKGVTYTENRQVRSYLIIGSDSYDGADGSRADAQFLVVVDDMNKTWRILMLDRDSMVNMDTYNSEGKFIGTTTAQLTLSHLFGTWEEGARNTVTTVSRLLWDQKIDGYFDMNMSAIPVLNDAVGGVTVKVTSDFAKVDPTLVQGQEVTLMGKQAETFVRGRHSVDDGTNESRMARQKTYLKALVKKIQQLSSDDILNIYDQLMANSVTDMGSKDFVDLADMAKSYEQLDTIQMKGEHVADGDFMEFNIDEDSLTETILELFYTK